MNKYLKILALALFVTACGEDGFVPPVLDELGAVKKEYELDYTEGSVDIRIYANKSGKASFLEDVKWAAIENPAFDGDAVITVGYTENRTGALREASILLTTSTRKDTVYLYQNFNNNL